MISRTPLAAATALVSVAASFACLPNAHAEGNLIGARLGYVLTGSGELEISDGDSSVSVDMDEETDFGFNAFLLFPVGKQLRVGGSIWYLPEYQIEVDGSSSGSGDDAPSQVNANVLLEYAIDLGGVDGFAYGEAGLSLLLPPEDADDEDTWVGYNAGGGFGAAFPVSRSLLFRVDGLLSLYNVSVDETLNGQDVTFTLSGTRVMLNAGVAFEL